MKKIILLLVLLIVSAVYAQEEASDLYGAKNLYIDFSIEGALETTDNPSKINSISAQLYLFPRESYRQSVISLDTNPKASQLGDFYEYYWSNPSKSNTFTMNSKIKTTNEFKKVTAKVHFPVDVPNEYEEFTVPTTKIDSDNADIVILANQLAQGEDDLFVLETKMANYVKDNIRYDLSTLTADASQSSSWVLENKYGVCDELTNLFIALNRALGVPSRFVKGISYTNSPLFDYNWGPHAWAEVYFPGYGWVPFDITYAELGYIDATHIELDYSDDSDTPTSRYSWKAIDGVEVKATEIDFTPTVTSKEGVLTDFVIVDAIVMDGNLGFGSYGVVEATITNPNPYYVPVTVLISRTQGIELFGDFSERILLKPSSETKLFWKFKLTDDLKSNYVYNFPISVYTLHNISDQVMITSTKRDSEYDEASIDYWIGTRDVKEDKVYSKDMTFSCTSNDMAYVGETVKVNCLASNKGNIMQNNLKLCLENNCQTINLGISQQETVSFDLITQINKKYTVTVENAYVSDVIDLELIVWEFPNLLVKELKAFSEVNYDQSFNISFFVEPLSKAPASDILVELDNGNSVYQEWKLDELSNQQQFILNLYGSDLNTGENAVTVTVTYHDANGEEYVTEQSIVVTLANLNMWQKIVIFFNNLF